MLTFPFYNSIEGFYIFTYLELLYFIFIPNDDTFSIIESREWER